MSEIPTNGLWFLSKVEKYPYSLTQLLTVRELPPLREWALREELVRTAKIFGEPPLTLTEKGKSLLNA